MPAYKNKDGIWCHRFMSPKNAHGAKHRIYVQCARELNTTTALKQLERDAIQRWLDGRFTTSDTFASYVKEKFIPEYTAANNLQESTRYNIWYSLEHLAIPEIGTKPLHAIDARVIAGLIGTLSGKRKRRGGAEKALANATIRCTVIWIKSLLRWAARLGDIPKFPEIDVPKLAEFAKPQAYSRDEIQLLFRHAADDRDRALFLLMFDAGLRRGEILGLTWQQVDFDHHTMKIDRQRLRTGDKLQTKSGRSRRLMMSRPLEAALHMIRRPIPATAYVICNEDGSPLSATWMCKTFRRAQKRAGLRRIRLHDARHSFATMRTDDGVNPFSLQQMLGHSNIRTTQLYVHTPENNTIPASALETEEPTKRRQAK